MSSFPTWRSELRRPARYGISRRIPGGVCHLDHVAQTCRQGFEERGDPRRDGTAWRTDWWCVRRAVLPGWQPGVGRGRRLPSRDAQSGLGCPGLGEDAPHHQRRRRNRELACQGDVARSDAAEVARECSAHMCSSRPRWAPPPRSPRRSATSTGSERAEDLAGPYDVIARVQARGLDQLGRLVVARIQAVDGVTRTLTCSVIRR
jgi:hypothetical protein